MRRWGVVFHAVHADLREFVILVALLEVIAPDAGLGFEGDLVLRASAEVAFFAVNVGRDPITRDQVQPPTIHVEEVGVPRSGSIRPVKPNDVEVLVLHPDPAQEAAPARILFGRHVENQATHIAKEFTVNVVEFVVLPVKVRPVGIHHPGKAHGLILNLEQFLEAAHQAGPHAFVLLFQVVFAIHGLAHIHAPEKVVVSAGHRAELRIGYQVLEVCLHHGRAVFECLHQPVFALDEAIDHLIHGCRLRQRRDRWRRSLLSLRRRRRLRSLPGRCWLRRLCSCGRGRRRRRL